MEKVLDHTHAYHKTAIRLAVFMVIVGICLLIAGLVIPPQGEIHSSVLIAFGEIITFAFTLIGSVIGVSAHYKSIIKQILTHNEKVSDQPH